MFDHLEEPDFDEEEMQQTAELLRQRQQQSLAARQKQRYEEADGAARAENYSDVESDEDDDEY